ncbi:exopolysaccharide biosynthesis protein [Cellvibrio sp. ARAG 10.3]|uniref:exopolysaccharide biosynthesis protein n=1 Tax=Cellvibrio sp. ARAG 10.3 TaxID=3451358 RepID=UPI003F44F86D
MNLTAVLDEIKENIDGDKISFGKIVDEFEDRGYGPLLLIAALFIMLPTGGIPGIPTVLAVVIIFIAAQLTWGRSTPWLPDKLRSISFDKAKFTKAANKIKPFTRKVDYILRPRLKRFAKKPMTRIIGAVIIGLCLFMPFLEIIPFADVIPSSSIVIISLGLTARDGIFTLVGLIAALVMLGGLATWLL